MKCCQCKTALKWKSKDGTSGLKSHTKSCSPETSSERRLLDMPLFSKPPVPVTLKGEVADKAVQMCTADIRPFSIVEGSRFKAMAQFILNVGAKYGKFDVDALLPCATTVSRHLDVAVAQ